MDCLDTLYVVNDELFPFRLLFHPVHFILCTAGLNLNGFTATALHCHPIRDQSNQTKT